MGVRGTDVDDSVEMAAHGRRIPHLEARRRGHGSSASLGDRVLVEIDAQSARAGISAQRAQQDLAAAAAGLQYERARREPQRPHGRIHSPLAHRIGKREAAVSDVSGARHAGGGSQIRGVNRPAPPAVAANAGIADPI
jgi:hypothetical protein